MREDYSAIEAACKAIGKKADAATPAGVDYDLWTGPAPLRTFNPNRFHYEWHWNWDHGTGELGNNGIPFCIVFTKTDKLTKTKLASQVAAYQQKMGETWAEIPQMFITSSVDKTGCDALLEQILAWVPTFQK